MDSKALRSVFTLFVLTAAVSGGLAARGAEEALEAGFRAPPPSARPHTWYHMMNGNVTKEGITCDFEALAKAGVGGVQMFDAGCNVPAGDMAFNTPEWFDMFRHAASEARRLGLEICIPNCSGWSSSGGPWNPPSNGMKRVVFTRTDVKGGKRFNGVLPRTKDDHGFYEDIAVMAIPLPAADLIAFPDAKSALDGKTARFTSSEPFTASGISFRLTYPWSWSNVAEATLAASDDGTAFRTVETFPIVLGQSGSCDYSLRYQALSRPVTAKALRLTLKTGIDAKIAEFRGEAKLRVANVKAKTFELRSTLTRMTCATRADQAVDKSALVDLSARMKPDGTLDWTAPEGRDWTILRLGYVCNGRMNHPASDNGCGLEVDKLSARALDYHFDQYVARLCRHLGPLAGDVASGFNNILVDSYEVGSQNWTQGFAETFEKRRGYAIKPYLPVFAGFVVGSMDETERFLEDFRRTVADLFAENYSGRLAKLCHDHGLKLSLEPYGNCPADNLQYGEPVDIPMGEFWSEAGVGDHNVACGNARYVSHLAHVWGRRYVGMEAFTASPNSGGRWMTTPFSIKAQGDRVYAAGANRIIYHRFTHQPWPGNKYLPGMTMGRWGMHLDRTQTWWPFAGDWFRYQARCQWMLQEGTFAADALFYAGEEAPNQGGNTDGGAKNDFALPDGYLWDVCATKALKQLKVADGRVVAPGGVSYALLVLPRTDTMSEETLDAVGRLVAAGARVSAFARPTRSPGLAGYPAADGRVAAKVAEIWKRGVLEMSPADALKRLGLAPDFTSTRPDAQNGAVFTHRRRGDADWYFVALNNVAHDTFEASFRTAGREPEIWDPLTGKTSAAPLWRVENGRTVVTLDFEPSGSAFVVFRRPAAAAHLAKASVRAARRADPKPAGEEPPTLVVKSARYGAFLGEAKEKARDFTARLAAKVVNGTVDVEIGNELAGGDPIFMTAKEAKIVYVENGCEKTAVLRERQRFTVPFGTESVKTPDYTWQDGALLAWQPLEATLETSDGATRTVRADPPAAVSVGGAWRVAFPTEWYTGDKAVKTLDWPRLRDWTDNDDPDIKYFSGTASYAKKVAFSTPAVAGAHVFLDLGRVRNFAEVTVNGRTYPVLWKPPYVLDVTDALKPGDTSFELKVRVTNLWPNRLIGDDALPEDVTWIGTVKNGVKEIGIKEIPDWVKQGRKSPTGRHTFTTWRHWAKDEPLLPSGLLGPVLVRTAVEVARLGAETPESVAKRRNYPARYCAATDTPAARAGLIAALFRRAPERETRLWPEGKVPLRASDKPLRILEHELWQRNVVVTDVNDPYFTFYPAPGDGRHPAVVILPGGGYRQLGWNKEGVEVAAWLNGLGFSAAVLLYRAPDQRDAALCDVQRTIGLLRRDAAHYRIDPDTIGVIGFSAGANLAIRAATHARRAYLRVDEADDLPCRPNFQMPIYPWDLRPLANPAKRNSWRGLKLRAEYPVDGETPPAFIVQSEDDFCQIETAVAYDLALRQAGVASTLRVYPNGGHGYGLRKLGRATDAWPDEAAAFLATYLKPARRILFLGDSITDKRHCGCTKNYWGYLADRYGFTPRVYGVNGQQMNGLVWQAKRYLDERHEQPDVIFVFAGTNDYNANVPLGTWYSVTNATVNRNGRAVTAKRRTFTADDTFRGRINRTMVYLREHFPGARIVLMTPPHRGFAQFGEKNVQPDESYANERGLFIDHYVAVLREAGSLWSAKVVDLFSEADIYPNAPGHAPFVGNPQRDRLHPSNRGHVRIAETIAAQVGDLLTRRSAR